LKFSSSDGATKWHEGLSWKYTRISAYGVRFKKRKEKTDRIDPQIYIFTWCCEAA
jgi:hypothetical protein